MATAAAAAEGLLSDRLSVFEAPEGSALQWQMAFETHEDVEQAVHSLQKGLFKSTQQVASVNPGEPLTHGCDGDAEGNPMAMTSKGLRVVLGIQARKVEAPALGCGRVAQWVKEAAR